jgi:outer membrane protein OmpA-like peptidoglycan-associated protein
MFVLGGIKMRKIFLLLLTVLLLNVGGTVEAAMYSECNCGEVCNYIKECEKVRVCEFEKFYDEDKVCSHKKINVCHYPPGNIENMHTICVGKSAVPAHLKHGDAVGKCIYETKKVCYNKECCKYVKKCECEPCEEPDSGVTDSGTTDSGITDGGITDNGVTDDSITDGGVTDSGTNDSMEVVEIDAGCGFCSDGTTKKKEKKSKKDELMMLGGGCSINNDNNPYVYIGFVLFAVILLFGMLIKNKIIIALSVLLLAGNVYAYDNDYNTTEGGKVLNHLTSEIGVKFNYVRKPAQIIRKSNNEMITETIAHNNILSLYNSMGFWNRLEIGITLPFELSQKTTGLQYLGENYTTRLDNGLGNLVFMTKLRLFSLDYDSIFHIGLIGPVELPTSTYSSIIGYDAPSFSPQLVLEFDSKYVDVGINIGYSLRMDNNLVFNSQNISMGDALIGSLGVKFAVLKDKIEIVNDNYFSMDVNEQDEEEIPVEIFGGLRFYLPRGFQVDAGAGMGLTKGIGAPEYRLVAGIGWSPEEPIVKTVIEKVPVVVFKDKKCPEIVKNAIVLPPLFFDFDKDNLTATSLPVMEFIIRTLQENPHVNKIVIDGHTDSKGSYEYNYNLSIRRANHVMNLLEKRGLKFKLIVESFHGETFPYTTNKTDDGRAQNRRVELHVIE